MDVIGKKGGLLLFWKEIVNLSILSYSNGHIDRCVFNIPHPFYFTCFYGNPEHCNYSLSWSLIDKIVITHANSNFGWLVGGDFNEILYDRDKKGGLPPNLSQINEFCETLNKHTLTTLKNSGPSSPRITKEKDQTVF